MSENMVERVAKAICDSAEADDFDALGQNSIVRALYVQQARHAIEAMRDPTPEMIQARIDSYPAELRIRQSDLEVYRAMLTAALA